VTAEPLHDQAWFDAEADRLWGEGEWVVCEQCPPDDAGFPVRHHRHAHDRL
jgi:hypothetical protein